VLTIKEPTAWQAVSHSFIVKLPIQRFGVFHNIKNAA